MSQRPVRTRLPGRARTAVLTFIGLAAWAGALWAAWDLAPRTVRMIDEFCLPAGPSERLLLGNAAATTAGLGALAAAACYVRRSPLSLVLATIAGVSVAGLLVAAHYRWLSHLAGRL